MRTAVLVIAVTAGLLAGCDEDEPSAGSTTPIEAYCEDTLGYWSPVATCAEGFYPVCAGGTWARRDEVNCDALPDGMQCRGYIDWVLVTDSDIECSDSGDVRCERFDGTATSAEILCDAPPAS